MEKAFALLERLADGEVHSGEALADALGVSRAAVWHQIKKLQGEGVEIHAVSGKGYRLPGGYEFLNRHAIELGLGEAASQRVLGLHIDRVTDSTNQRLLELSATHSVHGLAWLAELQTAGRGRRGGSWLAPPGSGLCLSLGWRFDSPPASMSAISLVVGIGVIRALKRIDARDLMLKWPNDVYHEERKLAGILIEMRSELGGPANLVIGIGLNLALSNDARSHIKDLATDVKSSCGYVPSRNKVAALLLEELTAVLADFAARGFAAYAAEWRNHDLLDGREIQLQLPERTVSGVARGVGPDGTLLIEHDGKTQAYLAGHIVMRAAR